MRGTLNLISIDGAEIGITPAYAGNTGCSRPANLRRMDHPRVCGEHTISFCLSLIPPGSPPRMRGTHAPRVLRRPRRGITPAYAGNTTQQKTRRNNARDHPRVCGEHVIPVKPITCILGSPPRMRGTLVSCSSQSLLCGITPAYAGNTFKVFDKSASFRDHPRVCGEHLAEIIVKDSTTGSPPRMRGTHKTNEVVIGIVGITPAYAGNTLNDNAIYALKRDHPRVCGEHSNKKQHAKQAEGSPPRMRGTRCRLQSLRLLIGITPAYAGNTHADYCITCAR